MNLQPVNMNAIVRQCVKLVDHQLELGNITLDLELTEGIPMVQGDSGQLEQLILALTINAIEAMPREGTLHLATSSSDDGTKVIAIVEDDGMGIPEELLPRLFEPFVTTKENHGVGLGLAISKSIVDRHRGVIEVNSQIGRGTRFTMTLPAVPAPVLSTREDDEGALQPVIEVKS
jgi:two-component system NtrC family sensor kinase